jgi:hypothetical protein
MHITQSSLCGARRVILLAPRRAAVPDFMTKASGGHEYETVMASMQRLRGAIYLKDGAIREWQLTSDGRHATEADERSWHVLLVDGSNEVYGCARYTEYPNHVSFGALGVSQSALAMSDQWGVRLREAVENEMLEARKEGLAYVEVGGWALREELRGTAEALRIALASYALAHVLGGCLGLATATYRHRSCSILRRLGGRPLEWGEAELPPYYDPTYECRMEVLRFDSRTPNEKYEGMTAELAQQLTTAAVYAPSEESLYSLGTHLLRDSQTSMRDADAGRVRR